MDGLLLPLLVGCHCRQKSEKRFSKTNMTFTTIKRLSTKGQTTIPKNIREKLGFEKGVKLDVYPMEDGFSVRLHQKSTGGANAPSRGGRRRRKPNYHFERFRGRTQPGRLPKKAA